MDCITKNLPLTAILVATRIRKDAGDTRELASDIQERGLINPLTVMDCGNGMYQLIAGLRRLEACKSLGHKAIRSTILSPLAADEMLRMEYAENVQRRDFTTAERLEYAQKIKAVERAKAHHRQAMYARSSHADCDQVPGNCPEPEKGEARESVAKKAGFTSSRQLRRVEAIAVKQPELLNEIDAGKKTIYSAYKQVVNKPVVAPALTTLPDMPRFPDQVARAKHDRLMKNPLYAELWEMHKKAVADANIAATELSIQSQGYENRIRNYQDNVNALSRRCEVLEQENAALRAQLDALSAEGENP